MLSLALAGLMSSVENGTGLQSQHHPGGEPCRAKLVLKPCPELRDPPEAVLDITCSFRKQWELFLSSYHSENVIFLRCHCNPTVGFGHFVSPLEKPEFRFVLNEQINNNI